MLIVDRDGSMSYEAWSERPARHLRWLVQRLKQLTQLYMAQFLAYHQPACGC
jgi:hypothetical protein